MQPVSVVHMAYLRITFRILYHLMNHTRARVQDGTDRTSTTICSRAVKFELHNACIYLYYDIAGCGLQYM